MNAVTDATAGGTTRIRNRRIVLTGLALAAAWAFDALVLRTGLLAPIHGRPAWTPLYAVPEVVLRPHALVFVAWSALVIWLAPGTCDGERWSSRRFALVLGTASATASFALFLVREDPSALGGLFDHYGHEEFVHDARAIVDPVAFLARYVDLMPELSTHGRHFPPGHALLLHGLMQVFGSGTAVAGWASLAGVGAGCVCAWRAVAIVCGEMRARQAAWLIATVPALFDFGAASMDSVFFAFAALALWLGLRALRAGATWKDACFAGCALFAATFFSFSALMLAMALAVYALLRSGVAGRGVLVQFASMTVAACLTGALLWFTTGFSIVDCAIEAKRAARDFMTSVSLRSTNTDRARLLFGNGVAFAIMSGIGTLAALTRSLAARATWQEAWTRAAIATLAVMCVLYYLETERIWLFALPWIAAIAALRSAWDAGSLRRILAANTLQALVMEASLFTLW